MVIIEPFEYQKITAFKERVQIISKVNEIVDAINNGDIGIQEDEVITLIENKLLNYYTKAEVDDAIASIDLSDFYTKSETNGMLSLKRDISDSYNKTEVDTKDTALGNRIDSCEDSISDLETNKQDVLTPVAPIEIDENKNLSINNQDVIINGKSHSSFFKIKAGQLGSQELRIVYDDSDTSDYMLVYSRGVNFRKGRGKVDSSYIKGAITLDDNNSFSKPMLNLSVAKTSSTTTNQKIISIMPIEINTTSESWGFAGCVSAPSSQAGHLGGIFFKLSDSGGTIIIGKALMSNKIFTDFDYGIKINSSKISIINSNNENEIAIVKDFPTGKNLSDTVTFQDLVDLGLIKAPTS